VTEEYDIGCNAVYLGRSPLTLRNCLRPASSWFLAWRAFADDGGNADLCMPSREYVRL
jgi:hypothetical protein